MDKTPALRPLVTGFALALALAVTAACGDLAPQDESSDVMTDLGSGNRRVVEDYQAYVAKQEGCRASGDGRRVLVTGFGLFTNVSYNISGVLVQALGSESYFPAEYRTSARPTNVDALPPAPSGRIRDEDHGGRVRNRTVTIDGETYHLCLVTLDVLWDLAAAIIVHEIERFEPHRVIMMGRGGTAAMIEGGALNQAITSVGYNSNGSIASENRPVPSPVPNSLPPIVTGAPDHLPMTWDVNRLHQRLRPLVSRLGFSLHRYFAARSTNNYICNNVSYVVLATLAGTDAPLAGGSLLVRAPRIAVEPKAGFFHLPDSATNSRDSVRGWTHVLANMIAASWD